MAKTWSEDGVNSPEQANNKEEQGDRQREIAKTMEGCKEAKETEMGRNKK